MQGDAAMTAEQRVAVTARLQSKKEAVEAQLLAAGGATKSPDARTKGFLQAQRVALVARKKAARFAPPSSSELFGATQSSEKGLARG